MFFPGKLQSPLSSLTPTCWCFLSLVAPKYIKMFVLDEADEMLSRGFKDQIYDIFQKLNSNTQVRERFLTGAEPRSSLSTVVCLGEWSRGAVKNPWGLPGAF